jgi:hypothetical protein
MARWTPPEASIQVKTEENEMEQSVEKIIERNLLEVFNARDADSRRAAIDELWDKDGVFIDPGGVHEGVEKINAIVQLLFTQGDRLLRVRNSTDTNAVKSTSDSDRSRARYLKYLFPARLLL